MEMNMNDTIIIIGNGPSTKALAEYGFHNLPDSIDTFAMGALIVISSASTGGQTITLGAT